VLQLIIGSLPISEILYWIPEIYELKKEWQMPWEIILPERIHRAVLDVGPAPFEIVYDEVEKNLLD